MKKIFKRDKESFFKTLQRSHNLNPGFFKQLQFEHVYTKKELMRMRDRVSTHKVFIANKKIMKLFERYLFPNRSMYLNIEHTIEYQMNFCWKVKFG